MISNLSLSLEPGKVMALVGPSGQGKTTILALILRLYDVSSGRILLDGTMDLRIADPAWLRSQIGYVSQEPVLFSGSLRENIGYGWRGADEALEADIIQAAKKVRI